MSSNHKYHFKFCPVCGGSLETKVHDHLERLVCSKCDFVFYQNSKPTASAIITNKDGQILLAKRSIKPKLGYWDLPGGFLEDGEDPQEGVRREVREELGVELNVGRIVGIYVDSYDHGITVNTINIIYECLIKTGELTPMDDINEVAWFNKDDIPWEKIAFENGKSSIRDWMK